MASFDPLSFLLVLLAISLECLGDIAVYLLDLPEWRMPREYIRSEYEPEEFCWYLIRWALDSRDTAFLFGVFFSLLLSLVLLGPLGFWWHQRYRAGVKRADDLQTRSDELKTRRRDDQETITQLRGENNALQSQNSEVSTRLDTLQQAISSIESVNAILQSQNIDLENKLSVEQAARQRDAAEASEAAKKLNDWIKRQDEEIIAQREVNVALRQRAETAEHALREKDNPIKVPEQQDQEGRLKHANERIKQLEAEAEERKSEQEALQNDLETVESKEHDLQNKLEAAEPERQKVQAKLEKTQTELTGAGQKFSKADNNASALQKKLTAADQLIKQKEAEYKTLTDDNSVTKQRCTELEQENKALNAAKKQQQDANPKLIVDLNKKVKPAEGKLREATERVNKLKREHSSDQDSLKQQLKTANSQKQDLVEKNRTAGLTNAKLTEKYDQATRNAERAKKLQQEHQSEHQSKLKVQQEAVFKAQSETQKAQEALNDCQQALKSTRHKKEKLVIDQNLALEAKDKEQRRRSARKTHASTRWRSA